ncbi:MAG TPA: transglycosylase SLT domain-containing protein [Desulfatiglandales bacterium]|nr:transglycosylase SLT domain-containing protein [Desulfatiglandales bacterium]
MHSYLRSLFFTLIIAILSCPSISLSQAKIQSKDIETDFLLPKTLTICGEPMPLSDPWVWEMLDREFTIAVCDEAQVFMWLKRAGRYFPYLEQKLAEEKMPQDIKYLSIAESSLISNIKSNKGAVGFWQFLSETARRNGLRSDKRIDERRDFVRSTESALNYLKKLKEMFGTWTLAMAAYNCGENRIEKETRKQQQTDYYSLKLPEETERYIYRIAAIKIIMENPETYGYMVPEEKIYKSVKCDTTSVDIKKAIHLTDLAKGLGTSFKVIRDLNPKIIDDYLPSGSYDLNTPIGTGAKVQEVLKTLSAKPSSVKYSSSSESYIVQEGDTLSTISRMTGIPVDRLKEINNIEGSLIKPGQALHLE